MPSGRSLGTRPQCFLRYWHRLSYRHECILLARPVIPVLLTHCTDEKAKSHLERLSYFLKVISVIHRTRPPAPAGQTLSFFPNHLFSVLLSGYQGRQERLSLYWGNLYVICQSGMLRWPPGVHKSWEEGGWVGC